MPSPSDSVEFYHKHASKDMSERLVAWDRHNHTKCVHNYLYKVENSASEEPVVVSLTPQWATRC